MCKNRIILVLFCIIYRPKFSIRKIYFKLSEPRLYNNYYIVQSYIKIENYYIPFVNNTIVQIRKFLDNDFIFEKQYLLPKVYFLPRFIENNK